MRGRVHTASYTYVLCMRPCRPIPRETVNKSKALYLSLTSTAVTDRTDLVGARTRPSWHRLHRFFSRILTATRVKKIGF